MSGPLFSACNACVGNSTFKNSTFKNVFIKLVCKYCIAYIVFAKCVFQKCVKQKCFHQQECALRKNVHRKNAALPFKENELLGRFGEKASEKVKLSQIRVTFFQIDQKLGEENFEAKMIFSLTLQSIN